MSTDVVSAAAAREPVDAAAVVPASSPDAAVSTPTPVSAGPSSASERQIQSAPPTSAPVFPHSPPDSNDATKSDASDSELSELEEEPILDDVPSETAPSPTAKKDSSPPASQSQEAPVAKETEEQEQEDEDIGEVLPDEWSGAVPIFRPSWLQFKDFKKFMKKVDRYGMKSGIIKIIPPKEWKDKQPPLDDLIKQIRVREPIKQDIMGSNGTYRQVNILHGRSYNVPQWRQLCDQSEHQPPAKRGERRANADKARSSRQRPAGSRTTDPITPGRRARGRPAKNKGKMSSDAVEERPMTPVSPKPEMEIGENDKRIEGPVDSIEHDEDLGEEAKDTADEASAGRSGRRMRGTRSNKHKTQSVSARRKYSRREGSAMVDEAAFKDFDYRMDASDYTPERCEELERAYWKTLTYAPPLYGADMMGTLFDDRTETWNLNKLPNLLDVLGTKIPGVNTAYLYLGMWKATFAWHLEDVDLYSINYLHFGAPKQWYSISQADARRFETAMKNVWPADAKACNQFLRHKGFLISPHHLLQQFGIKVNKVVSYPGEFVVTYPYGYHSGYNLGYNCAEAVNFALDTWLEMGKIAKRCECAQAQDSVWINVYEIERKLRGEETEYEETDDDDDEEEENDEELSGLPTPPASHGVKFKDRGKKRKRGPGDSTRVPKVKKIRLRLKSKAEPPCCLCPNDISYFDLLPTEDGRKAHKVCALYLPETYIDTIDGKEVVCNVGSIHKDRLSLKCLFCRSRRGACFQCSHKKCARGYHATCASAAGVFIEDQDVPVFDENGTEYKEQAFEFSCRFHRSRRDKKTDGDSLEANENIRVAAERLQPGQICQMQYLRGDIFAGIVIENRACEETLLLDILPHSTRLEVEWKWMVVPDPSDYRLPKASAKALPMPASHRAKNELNAKRAHDDKPKKDDVFAEGYTWAEFETLEVANKDQAKVDFDKSDQLWHYLGKTSTEARARYTEDPRRQYHNPKSNYLDTIPKPPKPVPVSRPIFHHQSYIAKAMAYSYNLAANHVAATAGAKSVAFEKPYVYKPKKPVTPRPAMSVAPQPASQTNGTFVAYTSSQLAGYHQTGTPAPASHLPQSTPSQDRHQVTANVPQVNIPAAAPQAQQATNVNQIHHLPHPQSFLSTQAPSVQSGKPIWQIHSSIYERYPFFQVNHNRESFKYRTPYSPYGGFANGYGGDPGASMTACSNATTGLSSTSSAAPQTPVFSISQPASQAPRTKHAPAAAKSTRTGCHSAASALSMQSTKAASQVPMKVSPVPLPPHVVAALAKSTSLAPNQRFGSGPAMGSNEPPSAPARNVQSPSMMAWHTSVRPQPVAPESFGSPRQHVQKPAPVVPHGMRPQLPRPMAMQPPLNARVQPTQEFADVPGSGSMEFVERMMQNLRRASLNGENR